VPGPDSAHAWQTLFAYIGPGADLSLVGYALTLLGFALTALSATLLWPVYALVRWIRGKKRPGPASPPEDAPGEAPAKTPAEQ
jgi:hypothetical protein